MNNIRLFLLQYLGLVPPQTQTTLEERQCLQKYATGKSRLLEVGVFQGVTTRILREVMASDGILYAVDPFYPNRLGVCFYYIIARRNVSQSKNGSVTWLAMKSEEVVKRQRDFFADTLLDFIFIDGDHSWEGIQTDWQGLSPLVSAGGIVAIHDSRDRGGCGSELYTNQVILNDPLFRVLDVVQTLTVLQRV